MSQVLDEKQRQLVGNNVRLLYRVVNVYIDRHGLYPGMNREDLEVAATDGLIVAATHYRPGRASFGHYAWSMIWRKMNGAVREQKRRGAARQRGTRRCGTLLDPDTLADKKTSDPLCLATIHNEVEAIWQGATHAERHFLRLCF